jgi:chorismate mutase
LIERAQFAHNERAYLPDGFRDALAKDGFEGSWLDWFIFQTEIMHGRPRRSRPAQLTTFAAKARRYESPEEHSFTPRHLLPVPLLEALDYRDLLHPNDINVNSTILDFYVKELVPAITRAHAKEDDTNYGSSTTRDLEVLQAISRRVHYG